MKKISLGMTLSLMALTAAAAISISYTVAIKQTNAKIQDINERQAMFSKLGEMDTLARRSFYNAIDEQSLAEALCTGYASGLNDENALYLDAAACRSYAEGGADPVIGIGAEVVMTHESLRVVTVYPDSPAEKAGLQVGDSILTIDGQSAADMSQLVAVSRLNRAEGTEVQLNIVRRSGDSGEEISEPKNIRITCAKFKPQTVTGRKLEDGTGYIAISRLRNDTTEDFHTMLDDFQTDGITGLVLDLRECGGNSVRAAAEVADLLLDEGATVQVLNGQGERKTEYEAGRGKAAVPVVCLINSSTNGAGEVLAAALQDGGVDCVGENTAGHAVKTVFSQLSDGSAVILPVGHYVRHDGTMISAGGVHPNAALGLKETQMNLFRLGKLLPEDDPQLQAAVEKLQK